MPDSKRLLLLAGLLGIALVTNIVGNAREPSRPIHASSTITVTIPLVTGYNFITVPVNLVGGFNVRDLSDQITAEGGQVVSVSDWNASSQSFLPWSSFAPNSNVFLIEKGKGYLVRVTTPPTDGSWTVTGEEITQNGPIDLSAGLFDMIGLPGLSQDATDPGGLAASVEVAGGELASVVAWDEGLQKYVPWASESPSVNNFQITSLMGFWIRAAEDITGFVASVTSSNVVTTGVSEPPANVHVELNPGGVIISWASSVEEDGFVEWALSAEDLAARSGTFAVAIDSRGQFQDRKNKRTHYVEIPDVPAGQAVHFHVFSGEARDLNGSFAVTLPTQPLISPPVLLTGELSLADQSGAEECLVYARVTDLVSDTILERSLWVVGLTKNGQFTLDLTNVRADPTNPRNSLIDKRLNYNQDSADSTIEVFSRCSSNTGGSVSVTTAAAQRSAAGYVVDLPVVSPEANDDSYMTPPGKVLMVIAPGVLVNDALGGTGLEAELVMGPSHGTLDLNLTGGFMYIPDQGYVGDDQFTYKATVDGFESNLATVSISVRLPKVPGVSAVGLILAAVLFGFGVVAVSQRITRDITKHTS